MSRRNASDVLLLARTPWGAQRFYPVGEHPAADRARDALGRLESFMLLLHIETPELLEIRDYLRGQIHAVEYGESIAKQRYLDAAGVL